MHIHGKLVIDVSMFVKTDNEEEAIEQAVGKVNYITLDKAKLLELLSNAILQVHDADIKWEDVVPE